jgi:hypothetical protein
MLNIIGLREMREHENFERVRKSKATSQFSEMLTMAALAPLWNNVFSNAGMETIPV